MQIKVNKENIGQRLDVFLVGSDKDISRSQWQKRINNGEVVVNDKNVSKHYRLKEGDKIDFMVGRVETKTPAKKIKFKVEVVGEGDGYVVVNKPSGMVVHADSVNKDNTLVDWLVDKYPEIKGVGGEERPGIVHRLDKEVSGLMVVAREGEMYESLKKQFQAREVKKEYMALVHGRMSQDEGEIKLPIGRSKKKGIFIAMSNILDGLMWGREAITKYRVEQKFRNFSLIRVQILTGRTHQIRVHLGSIGHGVVGDKLYETHDVRVKKRGVELGRLWLYAAKLGFRDLRGEWVEFESGAPKELDIFLGKLK